MEISNTNMAPLTGSSGKMSAAEEEKLRRACADFEALLNKQMLDSMRDTSLEPDGIFAKSHAEKMFQSLMDQELAEKIATGDGTGFGDMLFEQLMKNQRPTGDLS
ncbi:MAG: flagellar biosynthesis protein FlgJ [Desulfobulbaceae bacterium]|nr:MAG: flagellar biosynthesis protein FlgJ [Desulfobulbaceae bacterium]